MPQDTSHFVFEWKALNLNPVGVHTFFDQRGDPSPRNSNPTKTTFEALATNGQHRAKEQP